MRYAFERKFLFMTILFCAVAGILTVPASADVTSWKLSPSSPNVGDVIKISGEAGNDEKIEVYILHEEIVPVFEKSYIYQINKLKVPKSISGEKNLFKINATGENGIEVKDINVRVKKFKWFTRHSDALDGNASVSQSNVPSWMSYFVRIDGDVVSEKEKSEKNVYKSNSDNGEVKLVFETYYEAAKADKKGNFEFSYDTDSLPAGNYTIKVGDIEKEFALSPLKEKDTKEKNRLKIILK